MARVDGKVVLVSGGARVNSIHPGLVLTPMRRGAAPSEISTFVVFFVSDESTYATGAEFVIDGGLTSYEPVKI
jgi:3alpha(or 20beta)-hydroxysteroid dehydrogenase